ncbi:MAG TPA: TIR domain-containing protein, partial [Candidatus Kapabacteria bacterium]|nr:TIR domain-containing protein [Candidatus Kapabacteria bacterium]
MSDIFISYSRKDSEQALQLAERLQGEGMSVWIDQRGIEAAKCWSGEIVKAIDGCAVFLVLLSSHSIESENVNREVSIASEAGKKMLPVALEDIKLSTDMRYHLAGIQRVAITQMDSIIAALQALGVRIVARAKQSERRSLMILPFEDLSPTADNGWFADGIVSELISALANVKAIRLADAQATKEFKGYKGSLVNYAREMEIRYFLQGDVRKFGESIKISVRLIDIETGDQLWQDSLKGTMNDVFEIQEQIAVKVVGGLEVMLSSDELSKLTQHETEHSEAYELYMKGRHFFNRFTRSGFEHALKLYAEAIQLDPSYATAHASRAITASWLYRYYTQTEQLLKMASESASIVKQLEGETAQYWWVMSQVALASKDARKAIKYAERGIDTDPRYSPNYDSLTQANRSLGRLRDAALASEKHAELRNTTSALFNFVTLSASDASEADREKTVQTARRAVKLFERHVRLNPDDEHAKMQLGIMYHSANMTDQALGIADEFAKKTSLDPDVDYDL